MSANGLAHLATKELKQKAKLDLAQAKRQGYSAVTENTTEFVFNVDFSYGQVKVTDDTLGHAYLILVQPVPAISNLLRVGGTVVIDFAGNPQTTTIAGPLDFVPNDPWIGSYPDSRGYLLADNFGITGQPDYNVGSVTCGNSSYSGSGSADTSAPFYRERNTYDLTELPTQYNDNTILDNPNVDGLLEGRPWVNAAAFAFYEAFGTTSALSTTEYVSGNKIYAYSSSYDVPGYQNARVVVNDIEMFNGGTSTPARGHNLVVLDSYGDLVAAANFDTYNNAGNLTNLATALNAVPVGYIAVLVVFDASALDSTCRNILKNSFGSTNNNTWTASRVDHIFIGIKS